MKKLYWIIALFGIGGVMGYIFSTGNPFGVTRIDSLTIIPLGGWGGESSWDAEALQGIISEEFPGIQVSLAGPIALSPAAFNEERGQYDVLKLLEDLEKKIPNDQHVIAVMSQSLFKPGLNFVFSVTEGSVGIVSTDRLLENTDDEELKERLRKVSMRMVGSMVGLSPRLWGDDACVMRFSNSLEELDAKGTEWCGRERDKLVSAQVLSDSSQ